MKHLALALVLFALPAVAQVTNPELSPDPLNKIFFAARVFPDSGAVRSMQIEVATIRECLENVLKTFNVDAAFFKDAKAIEVRCIRERNAEKPL